MTAFDDFVQDAGPGLVRFARALTGDVHRGEDLTQAALAKAYVRWQRVVRAEHPVAYVKKMIVREELSRRRRGSTGEVPTEAVGAESPMRDIADAVVERQVTDQRLKSLPARQRAALALRYYEDLPDRETAAILGCTESTVRSLVATGLEALRQQGATSGDPQEVRDASRG